MRTGKTNQKAGHLLYSGVLSKHPRPPLPTLPQSLWILDLEGAQSVDLLDKIRPRHSLSPQARENQEKLPSLLTLHTGPGEENTQVLPGTTQRVVSQAWHPHPPPKPQTKTTQLPADLQALPGDGGTYDPGQGTHTHIYTRADHRDTHNTCEQTTPTYPVPTRPAGRPYPFPNSRCCRQGAECLITHPCPRPTPAKTKCPLCISAWPSLRNKIP